MKSFYVAPRVICSPDETIKTEKKISNKANKFKLQVKSKQHWLVQARVSKMTILKL